MAECQSQDIKMYRLNDQAEIILDDLAFNWYPSEMKNAVRLYNMGLSLPQMAEILRPGNAENGIDEIFLLLLHLARKGRIKEREGWIWGCIK